MYLINNTSANLIIRPLQPASDSLGWEGSSMILTHSPTYSQDYTQPTLGAAAPASPVATCDRLAGTCQGNIVTGEPATQLDRMKLRNGRVRRYRISSPTS